MDALTSQRTGWPVSVKQWLRLLVLCSLALAGSSAQLRAALQFDVFLGYDGTLREAAWFPVAFEISNDGPSFNAIVELSAGNIGTDQLRKVPVELPTNTRKRFVIPVFGSGGRFYQWNARLVDERGKVFADRSNLQPKVIPWEGFLLGAMPRSFAGVPTLPEGKSTRPDLKPQVARLQIEQFPDNPIALEGLDALYLNSEKALGLKISQITALLAWVYEGGRLIVSVEQLTDVNSTPWLQQLLPCDLTEVVNVPVDEELLQWIRKDNVDAAGSLPPERPTRSGKRQPSRGLAPGNVLAPDPNFLDAQVPVAVGRLRDGQVLLSAKNTPLVIQSNRGRGQVTVLTFSPEREPFRSWKHRPLFWAKVVELPPGSDEYASYGGWSLDGVFGALIDSRQVRKLPVEWLLLLLVVYLIVIGPLDQYWLKKINRQMLTWITFPTYVVLFSLLIYFIGYKLRAGETEWNELQVVDILPRHDRTALRGRTFASIYSSSNAKYQLAFTPPVGEAAEQTYASIRGELLDLNTGGGKEASHASVDQRGNVFRAEIFVPVWTSLLYVNDWFQPAAAPLAATLSNQADRLELTVENLLDHPLTDIRVAHNNQLYEFGTLAAHEKKVYPLQAGTSIPLPSWVAQHGGRFPDAVQSRRSALGDERRGHLEDLPLTSMVASFSGLLPKQEHQRNFVSPPGLDLSPLVDRGDAVVLAWDANGSYVTPVNQFKPPRLQRNALLRLAVPAPAPSKS